MRCHKCAEHDDFLIESNYDYYCEHCVSRMHIERQLEILLGAVFALSKEVYKTENGADNG